MALRRAPVHADDRAYDEQAQVFRFGDTTSSRRARDCMNEQQVLRESFGRALEKAVPKGARIKPVERLLENFCFVVDFADADDATLRYVLDMKAQFPTAVHLRKGLEDKWHVPYEEKARQGWVKCVNVAKLVVVLCVLAVLMALLVDMSKDL